MPKKKIEEATVEEKVQDLGSGVIQESPGSYEDKIISIDGSLQATTVESEEWADARLLNESFRGSKLLTGVISGTETKTTDGQSAVLAVISFGNNTHRVYVPATEMFPVVKEIRDRSPEEAAIIQLRRCLGAEIDFMVTKPLIEEDNIAIASRVEAMRAKMLGNYFAVNRWGTPVNRGRVLEPGMRVEARVMTVQNTYITCEVMGVDTDIPLLELSYTRMQDPHIKYSVGQRVAVRIKELEKDPEKGTVNLVCSIKDARPNPMRRNIHKYKEKDIFSGTVAGLTRSRIYVTLPDETTVSCRYPQREQVPLRGDRVSVKIMKIYPDTLKIDGLIVKGSY